MDYGRKQTYTLQFYNITSGGGSRIFSKFYFKMKKGTLKICLLNNTNFLVTTLSECEKLKKKHNSCFVFSIYITNYC